MVRGHTNLDMSHNDEPGKPLSEGEERLIAEALDDPTPSARWTRETKEEIKRWVIEKHRKASGR